jgi:hypothetical protein
MQGRSIGVRVFLEGIEIDVASVGVQGLLGQSATATIEIPAADAVHRLHPRTLVHVFYHENDHRLVDPTNRGSEALAGASDQVRESWRLLFAGEVVKYRYTNAGGSRQAVLVCQDFSSYWSAARLYWGSNNTSLHSYKQAVAAGATVMYSGKKRVRNTNALINLLLAKPSTNPKLTGLLGGVVSLMEAASGVFHPDAKRKFRGVNDFMSQAELRLHLTHMLGASPVDRTSAKYLSSFRFKRYVRRLARSIGSTASFADLLNLVLGRIHYNWMSVPAPPYFPKNEKSAVKSKVLEVRNAQAISDPQIRADVKVIRKLYNLTQARNKEALKRYGTTAGGPPQTVDNRADPHQLKSHTGGMNPTSEPDSGGHADYAEAARGFPKAAHWREQARRAKGRLRGTRAKSRFDARFGIAYSWVADAADLLHNTIIPTPGELGYVGHTTININKLRQLLEDGIRGLGGGLGGTLEGVSADVAVGDRLNCHLFTPDLFMAPPPTCNVMFPDHYTSIHFSRDWMSETTRLLLHTKTASGRDRKNIYFSPNADILAGPPDVDVLKAVKQGSSFLMEHELFTGPIIAIEGIGDSTIFRNIHKEVKKSNKKAGKKGEEVSGEALYSPQEHLRRAANYLFFAKRFASRTMVVQARFSPQLVVGLPCLVLDPLLSGRKFEDGDVPKGTHFIGTIAALIHHVDARGSATSTVHMVKCREHREADRLFSDKQKSKKMARSPGSKKIIGWQVFSSILKKDEPFRRANGTWRADRNRPIYTGRGKQTYKLRRADTLAPTGRSYDVEGPEGRIPLIAITPRGVHVEVVVTRSIHREGVDKSISFNYEQTATPPWFAECFLPHNIGKQFYQPMLGCGSVLDDNPLLTRLDTEAAKADKAAQDRAVADRAAALQAAADAGKDPPPEEDPVAPNDAVTLKVRNGDGTTRKVEIPGLLLLPVRSTQQAADQLAGSWRLLTESGANMSLFVDSYVSRAYANLPQIMGDLNLDLRFREGHQLLSGSSKSLLPGFHGNAYGNLTQMLTYPDRDGAQTALQFEPLASLTAGSTTQNLRKVSRHVDPRKERRDRVIEYVNELRDHH